MRGFASDYDGTLDLRRGGGISQADCDAIRAFRAQGGVFGVNTGRIRSSLFRKVEGRLILDFCVLVSGALVTDGAGTVIWERRIPREVVATLVRRFLLPTCGMYLVNGDGYWRASRLGSLLPHGSQINLSRTLAEIPVPLYGVSFLLLSAQLARWVADTINRDYGDVVSAYQNVKSVDVVPSGCSKATGLEIVRRELGVDVMAAMGDSFNDVPMLSAAQVAYTFPSAPEEVRTVADAVMSSVASALADFAGRSC
jgi:hypothetical protein